MFNSAIFTSGDGDECLDVDRERLLGLEADHVTLATRESVSQWEWVEGEGLFKDPLPDDQLQRLTTQGRLPQVVLMDVLMPRMDGIDAIRAVLAAHPGVRVVVLTSLGELERVHAALEAGASGYLLKDADPDDLVEGVRRSGRAGDTSGAM